MRLSRGILALLGAVAAVEISVATFLIWLFAITPSPVPIVWDEASESFAGYKGDGHAVMLHVTSHDYGYWDSWSEWTSIMRMRMAAGMSPIHRADLNFSFRCFPFIAHSSNGPRRVFQTFRQFGISDMDVQFEEQFIFCEQLLATEIEQLEVLSAEDPSSSHANLGVHFSEARIGFLPSVDRD